MERNKQIYNNGKTIKNKIIVVVNQIWKNLDKDKKYWIEYNFAFIFSLLDEQAITFIGSNELYIGEQAKFTAIIDPRISKLCNIFWKRTDERGQCYTIDINDGQYKGSTITLPFPELHINCVRKQDTGTYRLFVDTFNKVVHNCVKLIVKEGKEGGKSFFFY